MMREAWGAVDRRAKMTSRSAATQLSMIAAFLLAAPALAQEQAPDASATGVPDATVEEGGEGVQRASKVPLIVQRVREKEAGPGVTG